jgi:hypothetical protein
VLAESYLQFFSAVAMNNDLSTRVTSLEQRDAQQQETNAQQQETIDSLVSRYDNVVQERNRDREQMASMVAEQEMMKAYLRAKDPGYLVQ